MYFFKDIYNNFYFMIDRLEIKEKKSFGRMFFREQCPRCALRVVKCYPFFFLSSSFVSFWFSLAQGSRLWATLGIPLRQLGIVKRKLAKRLCLSNGKWRKVNEMVRSRWNIIPRSFWFMEWLCQVNLIHSWQFLKRIQYI